MINDNLCQVKSIVNENNILQVDPTNGWPLTFLAIKFQRRDILRYLVDQTAAAQRSRGAEALANEIQVDFDGNSALLIRHSTSPNNLFSILFGNVSAFYLFLDRYPESIHISNIKGDSPIFAASRLGRTDILKVGTRVRHLNASTDVA